MVFFNEFNCRKDKKNQYFLILFSLNLSFDVRIKSKYSTRPVQKGAKVLRVILQIQQHL